MKTGERQRRSQIIREESARIKKKQQTLFQTGPLTSTVPWEGMEIWLSWKPTSQQALPPRLIPPVLRWTPVKERCMGAFLGESPFHYQSKGNKSAGVLSEGGKSIRHIVIDTGVSPVYCKRAKVARNENIFTEP